MALTLFFCLFSRVFFSRDGFSRTPCGAEGAFVLQEQGSGFSDAKYHGGHRILTVDNAEAAIT